MSIQVTELSNGLRVVSDRVETVETVSLGAWVNVGTRDEDPELNGISHLLEHMAFKGTTRRTALQIVEEIEDVGGHLNAYTAREMTAYYAKVLKDDVPLAIDIIADILQHSVMDTDELAHEQDVIVQEINQSHDTPDDVVFDYFQETAFPGQAIGRPVLGTESLVRAIDSRTLLDYMAKHYSAPKMILSAAGNLDHDQLVKLAEAAFDALGQGNTSGRAKAEYIGGDCRHSREVEQVHVLVGLAGMPFNDDDYHAATVFSTILGGGMSSRLFQEVREKRGLAYSIYSFLGSYTDGGIFGVYAGTGADDAAQLAPLVFDEIERLAGGANEDEIMRARTQLKSGMLMSLESTSSRSEQLARQMMIYGRPIPVAETVAKIEAVDNASIRRVGERLLASAATLTALGPEAGVNGISSLSNRTAAE